MLQQLDQNPWDLRFECTNTGRSQPACNQHNNRYHSCCCVRKQSAKSSLEHQWKLLTQLTLNQKETELKSSVQASTGTQGASTPYDDVLWKANTNAVSTNRSQFFQSPVEVTSEAFEARFDSGSKQFTFVLEEPGEACEGPTISGLSESPVFGKPLLPPPLPNEEDAPPNGENLQDLFPRGRAAGAWMSAGKSTPFTTFCNSGSAGTRSVPLSNKRRSRNERRDTETELYCAIPPIGRNISSSDSEAEIFDSEVTSCGSEASSRGTNAVEGHRNDGVSHMDGAVTFRNPTVAVDSYGSRMEHTAFATVAPEPARPLSLSSSGFAAQGGSDSSTRMAVPLYSREPLAGRPSGSSSSSSTTRKGEDQRQRKIIASQPSSNGKAENNRKRFSPHSVGPAVGSPTSARSASVPTSGVSRMDEHHGKSFNEDVGLEIYHGTSGYSPLVRKLQHDQELLGGASLNIPEAMRVSRRCPCAQHSSRMERFARWYHEREVQKQKRREAARQKHALTLPEFREAFPSRAEDDAEDASTEAGTASLLRGERVRRVYDECLQNWVPFTERHPELVRSVATLMRREGDRKSRWRSSSLLSKSAVTSGLPVERGGIADQRSVMMPPRSALVGSARSPRFATTPRSNRLESSQDARRPAAFNDGGGFSKWGPPQHPVGQSAPAARGMDRDYGAGETSGMTVDELQRHGFGGPFPAAESQGAVTGPAGFIRAATVHPESPVLVGGWANPHSSAVPAVPTPHIASPYVGRFWGNAGLLPGGAWEGTTSPSQLQVRGRAKLWDPGCPSQLVNGPFSDMQVPEPRFNPPHGNQGFMFGPAGVAREQWPTTPGTTWMSGRRGPFVTPGVGYPDLRYRESGSDEDRGTSMPGREAWLGEQRAPERGAVQFRLDEADGVSDDKRRHQKQTGGRGLSEGHLTPAMSQSKRAVRGETKGRGTEEPARKASTVRRNVEATKTTSQKGTGPRQPLSSLWRSTYPTPSKTQAAQPRNAPERERNAPFVAAHKAEELRSSQKVPSEESSGRNEGGVSRSLPREAQLSAAQVVSPGKVSSHPTDSLARAPSFELSLIQDSSAGRSETQPEASCTAGMASEAENNVPTFGDRRRPQETRRMAAHASTQEPAVVSCRSETRREDKPTASLTTPASAAQDYIVTPIDGSHTSYLFRADPGTSTSEIAETATHLRWGGDGGTVTAACPSSFSPPPAPGQPTSPMFKDVVVVEHQHPEQGRISQPTPPVSRDVTESVPPHHVGHTGALGPASAVSKQVVVAAPASSKDGTTVTESREGGAHSDGVGASIGFRDRPEASVPHVTVLPAGGHYGPNMVEVRTSAEGTSFKANGGVKESKTVEPSAWSQEERGARVVGTERARVASGGTLWRCQQPPTGVLEPQRSLPSIRASQCRVVAPGVRVAEPLFEYPTETSQQAFLVPLACSNVPIFSARRRRSLSPFGFRGSRRVNG